MTSLWLMRISAEQDYVGKLQAHIMELDGFNGIFGFSSRQRGLMMEMHQRLGQLGAGVKYFGQPARWDQPTADRNYDVDYVRAAWNDLAPLVQHKGFRDSHVLRAMRLRFRFLPFFSPKFAAAKLPPRTDSKGVKVMEYFGPIKWDKNPAA